MRASILFSFAAVVQASTIYSITDLGTLGGAPAVGFQINASGIAIGWAQNAFGDQQAFSSASGGALQNLPGLPGATDSFAYGINASGTIVGISYVNGQAHGEIWSGGFTTDLGAGIFSTGINDPGAIIGGNGHAFLLVNGVYRDLGVLPGGSWSAAYATNNAGTVAGYGDIGGGLFRAFVWTSSGGMQKLGTLGGSNSYATGINSSGEVVGHAGAPGGYEHAFLAIGSVMMDLGTLGGESSYAYGINDSGTVVGDSTLADGQTTHAFIYANDVMLDLNSLIPNGSGWQLLEAYGINNAGQIVGEGLLNGHAHAFELNPQSVFSLQTFAPDPVPDPGTASLTGIGLALLLACVRWKHRLTRYTVCRE